MHISGAETRYFNSRLTLMGIIEAISLFPIVRQEKENTKQSPFSQEKMSIFMILQ